MVYLLRTIRCLDQSRSSGAEVFHEQGRPAPRGSVGVPGVVLEEVQSCRERPLGAPLVSRLHVWSWPRLTLLVSVGVDS